MTSITSLPAPAIVNLPRAETPHASASAIEPAIAPGPAAPAGVSGLQTALANQRNWEVLAAKLSAVHQDLTARVPADNSLTSAEVTSRLAPESQVSLESFLLQNGLKVPTSLDALGELVKTLNQKAALHPLGNLGGGLSWPVPMTTEGRQSIADFLQSNNTSLAGLPLADASKGALAYLLSGSPTTAADLQAPRTALQQLLDTPKAQALGQALQTHLKGASSGTSIYDYLLTAIQVGLDPESLTGPVRNAVAGFQLDAQAQWGQHASVIVDRLSQHLIDSGRATTQTAKFAAHLLLSRTAPQYLVKDLPASVTYGSIAWSQLTIEVAKLEAQAPGSVQNMSYAQVLLAAEGMALADDRVQREVLRDWAVVNGVLESAEQVPGDAQIERIRIHYNSKLEALTHVSTQLQTPFPSRKAIALYCLKQEFPDHDPQIFEQKVLQKRFGNTRRGDPTLRSMLDIAMEGDKLQSGFRWESSRSLVPMTAFNAYCRSERFHVVDVFNTQYKEALESQSEGHAGMVKYLLSKLPLEDRKNLEFGKIEFLHTNDYKIAMDILSPLTLEKRGHTLHVKTTRNGEVNIYEIDTHKASIEKQNYLSNKFSEPYSREKLDTRTANIISRTELFDPYNGERANQTGGWVGADHTAEWTGADYTPYSYGGPRTKLIADAFVKSLDLGNEDLLNYAKGVTSYDKARQVNAAIGEFFLNLIPFRSAIVNFKNGQVGDGLFDLGVDIIGLVTLGAGKAAQASKALAKGAQSISAAGKAAKVAKFIGVTALEALNPVGGAGDALMGATKLAGKGLAKTGEWLNKFKGASGSYDLLKAASKTYDVAALGTYKIAEQTVGGSAVFREGKWYGYDAINHRPYGPALKDFTPKVAALEGEIKAFADSWFGKMIGSVLAPPANNPNYRRDFMAAVANAKTEDKAAYILGQNNVKPDAIYGYSTALSIEDLKRLAVAERRTPAELGSLVKRIDELEALPERFKSAREAAQIVDADMFKKGYDSGNPERIREFSDTLTNYQLAELAIAPGRTSEEFGQLVKYLENRRIKVSQENFKEFAAEITAAGGKATPIPQGYYLSQVSPLSGGECAALSNVMAAAVRHRKQDTFIKNLYVAMVPTLSPGDIAQLRKTDPVNAGIQELKASKVAKFNDQISQLQEILGGQFHHGMQARQVPYTQIISELAGARTSKTLLINGPDHGFTAGVVISNGKKEWFYFDPNYGKATFSTEAQMSAALESTLKSGRTKYLLAHFGQNPQVPEYKISVFEEPALNSVTATVPGSVQDLFLTDL
jgi:hypothetical protein